MSKILPESISIENAVAEMVNMNYIPPGLTLLEMLEAFFEEAKADYENAQIDELTEEKTAPLRIRMYSCRARLALAELLMKSLQYEIDHPEDSVIVPVDDYRLTLDSVIHWAIDRYGIGLPQYIYGSHNIKKNLWNDVTIRIMKDFTIEWFLKNGVPQIVNPKDCGFIGKKREKTNKEFKTLCWLNVRRTPEQAVADENERISKYRLATILKRMTGLTDDPFYQRNKEEGWKHRFTLINEILDSKDPDYDYHRKKHTSDIENYSSSDDQFDVDDSDAEILANMTYEEYRHSNEDLDSLRDARSRRA